MNRQFDILDIISILSFYIAIQNLQENEEQSRILQTKLDDQDNEYLKKIILQNQQIIEKLEELLKRR